MKTIIDVGANDGSVSLPWVSQDTVVYAFEPEPEAFQALTNNRNRLSEDLQKNYIVINKAISSSEGIKDFYLSKDVASSSLLPYTEEGIKKWVCPPGREHGTRGVVQVEAITLERFIREHNINEIELLKIDTQGHDFEVLKSAGEFLKKVHRVVFELQVTPFELYSGASKPEETLEYMDTMGFFLVGEEQNTGDQEINYYYENRFL